MELFRFNNARTNIKTISVKYKVQYIIVKFTIEDFCFILMDLNE